MTDPSTYRQYAESSEWQIDEDRERLLNELLQHRGYEERVSAKELARVTGINDSTVRDVIIELREEVGIPVANRGSGYFIVTDADELEDIIDSPDELEEIIEYYQGEIRTKEERLQTIVSNFNRSP